MVAFVNLRFEAIRHDSARDLSLLNVCVFATVLFNMAEFFAKGQQSKFTKMSKQFAQEQVMSY